ncbi:MAG: thermonuclease family protein [Bacteroidales bacterium]
MKNIFKYFILILVTLTFSLSVSSCSSIYYWTNSSKYLVVKRVVDGDTFWVDDGSEKGLKVRLIGVNTPETVDPRKPVEYYGKEASNYVKGLLNGKKVKLRYDVNRYDRYGRILAYVYLKDGTFLNADLIKKGFAQVMTFPPNVKFSKKFVELQREARDAKAGLWGRE